MPDIGWCPVSLNLTTMNSYIKLSSYPRAILHVDCDAFFASCEQAVNPALRGKPVVTGKERGIVAAASYEAKARGIKRGVPLWEVKKLCPDAVILPSDYETYSLFSKRLFAVMRRFTPTVEEYSIDEAFADITGFQRPYHCSYEEIALKMKETIERELGLTVSVGLSLSKVLAKIGSKFKKPAGFTPIPGRKIHEFLAVTPIEKIWGIGPRTAAYCQAQGIMTALDYALKGEKFIQEHFTKPHQEIWRELNGDAVYQIETAEKTTYATISKTRTFTPPSSDREYVYAQLLKNLENACIKARRHGLLAKGLAIYLRTQEYRTSAMEATLSRASSYPPDIVKPLLSMFTKLFRPGTPYRATGVVLTDLRPEEGVQLNLFEPPMRVERLKRVYGVVDGLAEKYGKHTLFLGASAAAHKIPQHELDRGDIPWRKTNRLKGESRRKHLPLPLLETR
jgi:DNA polymerase-4/DNA polymerase V